MTSRFAARPRRRAWALAGGGAAMLALGAAATVGFGGGATVTATGPDLPPATARVVRQTMLDTDEVNGDLGYGGRATLAGRISGVITKVPLPGDVIRRGRPIYRVDDQPIVMMYGPVPAYRTLRPGVTGADVLQLETNLKVLGYGGFQIDTTYSAATATAVQRWQRALGLPQTGRVEQGRVLFAPSAIRIENVTAGVNLSTGDGQEVLQYTGTSRQVTVLLEVSEQRLARKGVQVRIQLPDGKDVPGQVDRVSTVIDQPPASDSSPETRIEAVISLKDPTAAAGIEAAVVKVAFTSAERKGVLTVPVAALVALAEGGYGVEIVEGATTRYLKVQTGLFAGGRVEVTGVGLHEDMTVGMPS